MIRLNVMERSVPRACTQLGRWAVQVLQEPAWLCVQRSRCVAAGATSFDEMLELSSRGDSSNVDMLVGDIYGRDYETIGLSATTIASSFGKVVSGTKQLSDYNPAGALLRKERSTSSYNS